jgi:hypothetical protein
MGRQTTEEALRQDGQKANGIQHTSGVVSFLLIPNHDALTPANQ